MIKMFGISSNANGLIPKDTYQQQDQSFNIQMDQLKVFYKLSRGYNNASKYFAQTFMSPHYMSVYIVDIRVFWLYYGTYWTEFWSLTGATSHQPQINNYDYKL